MDPNTSNIYKQIRPLPNENKTFKYELFCSRGIFLRKSLPLKTIWIIEWEVVNDYFLSAYLMTMPKTQKVQYILFLFIFYCIVSNYKWILNEECYVSFC